VPNCPQQSTALVAANNGPLALANASSDKAKTLFFIECVLRKGSLSRRAMIGDHDWPKIAQGLVVASGR
jgi:hypothetical protein